MNSRELQKLVEGGQFSQGRFTAASCIYIAFFIDFFYVIDFFFFNKCNFAYFPIFV